MIMALFERAGALETLLDASIMMIITFTTLIALYLLTKAYSQVILLFSQKRLADDNIETSPEDKETELISKDVFSSGKLVLKDVDEPTAAMIMAIVSDESGIPLDRLIFRSIKLITS